MKMDELFKRNFLALAQAYMDAEGCTLPTVSKRAKRGDSSFFTRMAETNSSTSAKTYDEVVQWFSDNWPQKAVWPEFVSRPPKSPATPESK